MSDAPWEPALADVNDIQRAEQEWRHAQEAKAQMESGAWTERVTRLREAVAVLRDAVVPIGDVRDRFERLVNEMSVHLPERRTGRR